MLVAWQGMVYGPMINVPGTMDVHACLLAQHVLAKLELPES